MRNLSGLTSFLRYRNSLYKFAAESSIPKIEPAFVEGQKDDKGNVITRDPLKVYEDTPEGKALKDYYYTNDFSKLAPVYDLLRNLQDSNPKEYKKQKERLAPYLIKAPTFSGYSQEAAENILARTIWGEGRSEGNEGRHHIATVIKNRSGGNLQELIPVAWEPWQFSLWNKRKPIFSEAFSPENYVIETPGPVSKSVLEERAWLDSQQLAKQLVEDALVSDGNYNMYLNPQTASEKAKTTWGTTMKNQKSIRKHKFGYLSDHDPDYGYSASSNNKRAIEKEKAEQKLISESAKNKKYTVRDGDNGVSYVAKHFKNRGFYPEKTLQALVDEIIKSNNMAATNPVIRVGQNIVLP